MKYFHSTLTREQHGANSMNADEIFNDGVGTGSDGKWSREDFQNGTVQKHSDAQKAKEKTAEQTFEEGLSNPRTLEELRQNGSREDKLRAFDYLTRTEQKPEKTYSDNLSGIRQKQRDDRITNIQNMIDKG